MHTHFSWVVDCNMGSRYKLYDMGFLKVYFLIILLVLISCKRKTANNEDSESEKVVQAETSDYGISDNTNDEPVVIENEIQRPYRIDEFIRFGDSGRDTTYLIIEKSQSGRISTKIMDYREILTLDFASRNIDSINIDISKFKKLENLIGYNNSITYTPNSICKLKGLKQINLDANNIKVIPSCISSLAELELLFFAENDIYHIPDDIGELRNLRKIQLNGNKIDKLPESFYDLNNLTYCYLSNNLIQVIDKRILDMDKLETLNLRNNPLNEEAKLILNKLKEIRPEMKLRF